MRNIAPDLIVVVFLGCKPPSKPKARNVLMICVDSLRPDHLGCYGYGRDTAPRIDGLAEKGTRFTQAVSVSSWTMPTIASVFTGLYPHRHGMTGYGSRLCRARALAEVLGEAGFRTGAVVSSPTVADKFGFARGFDLYDDQSAYLDLSLDFSTLSGPISTEREEDVTALVASPTVTELASAWIRRHATERFFLYLHYNDPHWDYVPPEPYASRFDPQYTGKFDGRGIKNSPHLIPGVSERDLAHVVALYDGEIAFTDEHVGRLLSVLQELHLEDGTLIVLFADHGEEFLEHGGTTHGTTLYDEVLRVPLIFCFPPAVESGLAAEGQVSLVDVMPTVLDLVGVDIPEGLDGRSLAPVMMGRKLRPSPVLLELDGETHLVGARTEEWKALCSPDGEAWEFYDLARDPGENTNLGRKAAEGQSAAALVSSLIERRSKQQAAGNSPVDTDARAVKRIKALGY